MEERGRIHCENIEQKAVMQNQAAELDALRNQLSARSPHGSGWQALKQILLCFRSTR
jgi:hypothetical protein